jgi:hypothetical protein
LLLEAQLALGLILNFGDRKIFSKDIKKNYPSEASIDMVHNKMGIVGYSKSIQREKI